MRYIDDVIRMPTEKKRETDRQTDMQRERDTDRQTEIFRIHNYVKMILKLLFI